MSNTSLTNDLVERSKKIFDSLGLKNLDIKIFEDNNGEKTSQHIHVDENGATVDNKGTDCTDSKKTCQNKESKEAYQKRLEDVSKSLTDWMFGNKDSRGLMADLKKTFEERCKNQFGDINVNVDNLCQEINRCAKSFFDDPIFGNAAKRLKEVGINLNQEDINKAAEELKKLWGYTKKEESKPVEKPVEDKTKPTDSLSGTDFRPNKTKAALLKEAIDKEINTQKENEKHNMDIELSMKDLIVKAIEARAFSLFDGINSNEKNAGISILIDFSNLPAPKATTKSKLAEGAGARVKEEYGFSTYSLVLPSLATGNKWRYKFWF